LSRFWFLLGQSWSSTLTRVKLNLKLQPKCAEQGGARGVRHAEQAWEEKMRNINPVMAFLLGVAVVGLGVLGYMLYERQNRQVLKIDVPGFQGEITRDKGIDLEVGKDR
jgi:hypothetical protein